MTQLIGHNLRFLHPTSLFRELVLLDEMASSSRVTQSSLALRAGVVPAMVNNYIKTFTKKGYISVEGNNRDMRYTVTPEGEKYRFSLLLSYFRETVGLYKNVKEEIQNTLNEFLAEGIRSIVLYGAAETAELTLNAADCIGIKVIGVVDGDQTKQGKDFFGNIIEAPAKIAEIMPDAVVISSSGHQEEIYQEIKQYESRGIKIRKL